MKTHKNVVSYHLIKLSVLSLGIGTLLKGIYKAHITNTGSFTTLCMMTDGIITQKTTVKQEQLQRQQSHSIRKLIYINNHEIC